MKLPIVIEDSKIPKLLSIFIQIGAITLWPFIISRNKMNEQTLNHEKIHIRQQQEMLVVFFYVLYVYYWLRGLWMYRNSHIAYMSIPFELEASEHEDDMDYLSNRKWFSWWRYR